MSWSPSLQSVTLANLRKLPQLENFSEEQIFEISKELLYDILRKLPSNLNVIFNLQSENKLNISAGNSKFNLLCLPIDNFPNFTDDFKSNGINIIDRSRKLASGKSPEILSWKHAINFVWIKGHSGHIQNERCDRLAVKAAKHSDLPEDLGYNR